MPPAPATLDSALALVPTDEAGARRVLQRLWAEADPSGDAETAWQAAAAALLAINYNFVDFRGSAAWCSRFAAGLPAAREAGLCERARRGERPALRGCAAHLVWPMLDHEALAPPEAAAGVAEAAAALSEGLRTESTLPAAERLMLAKCLLDHHGQQMDTLAAARVIALQQEKLGDAAAEPAVLAHWWFSTMSHHRFYGNANAAQQAEARLRALADAHDLPLLRFALLTDGMQDAVKAGQLMRAERIHRALESLMPEVMAGALPQGLRAQALYLAQRGDFNAALDKIDRLLAICRDVEVPARDQGAYHALRANVLAALGRFDEARQALVAQRPFQLGTQGDTLEVLLQFMEAAACLDTRPDQVLQHLAPALAGAARLHYNRFFLSAPALAARLCQVALDAGIEPEFVRATIRDRNLCAPDPTRPDWPWRLRIHVMGPLAIWRDDLPLRSVGKAQRKPLELLTLLAAHGGGPMDAGAVMDALWPSLDAEAPKASLEMAISRLRKLLELPDAVVVAEGTVALNPAAVWCDAVAFEALAQPLQAALQTKSGGPPDAGLAQRASRLFTLYRDRLLGGESLAGPMALARERLALRFYGAVTAWGAQLEAQHDWGAAIAWYQRALTHEALAEPIYRALMRTHLARGERAEALRTYRRCCDMLAAGLGTRPAAETQALLDQAMAGG